ncbi:MAG TPA: glycosyl transferase family 1, partial [Phycisphaerae bacterium]|nr:glycosyl transferase family 1 [Phycisphaerae bacterium]
MRGYVLPPLSLAPFPEIDLRHVLVLTDDTAMLQHATHATPDVRHGYCTDDTARALIAGVLFCDLQPGRRAAGGGPGVPVELAVAMQRYLGFLSYAFNPDTGRFRNFMDYDRSWAEQTGSEDSHARALWGLGVAFRRGHVADVQKLAGTLFRNALPSVESFEHVRPWAYVLLGLQEYLRRAPNDERAADIRR